MEWTCEFEEENGEGYYLFYRNSIEMYDIPSDRCATEREINEWIGHMAEKNWWTEKLEVAFINLWQKENDR